ncbi:alpha/beta hydrolase [Curtobacterium sp. MCPF17_047]|uniref:alpha/beta fold hydrolase n=1 Tax=unclassified Curtobacterium TaxID=257496 RepID=UPI000DA88733|nr:MULTISPECIES: alpha/beta hydrolase [unclassified Curtobacterium]PZE60356.1 alpha/beta hydrolase [Curtobacterium sp. MCPF17_001]PZF67814.1 alpha/beta hydrolase [Curtobacterium sp. MCPF17_047]WIB12593.1 alpha/beta hydrolase [Curtobacterium sp. MCPF17_052]
MTNRSALLVHGLGSAAGTWWRFEEELQAMGWSVAAPDLRGHGAGTRGGASRHDDYADDVLALRPASGPWDVVVGHSLGGAIAVRAAARDTSWARQLVLIDPVLRLDEGVRADTRRQELIALESSLEQVVAEQPHWDARDHAERFVGLQAADPAAVAATFDDNDPWDRLADVAALRAPTLIIAGDPKVFTVFGPSIAREVLGANSRVRYETVAGAGHSPHRDCPGATSALLREWVDNLATSGASARRRRTGEHFEE